MQDKKTLNQALKAWRSWKAPARELGDHIPPAELYELFIHPESNPDRGPLLDHLVQCPVCLRELEDIIHSTAGAATAMAGLDYAAAMAAASLTRGPKRISTRGGKYTIEIRPHISRENRGIVTVQVAPRYRDELEGRTLTIKDRQGRVLLQGRIINSEASQEIDGLDQIEYGLLIQSA